jgi:hypothetical protein
VKKGGGKDGILEVDGKEIYERKLGEGKRMGMDRPGIDGRHLVTMLIRGLLPKLTRRFFPFRDESDDSLL